MIQLTGLHVMPLLTLLVQDENYCLSELLIVQRSQNNRAALPGPLREGLALRERRLVQELDCLRRLKLMSKTQLVTLVHGGSA